MYRGKYYKIQNFGGGYCGNLPDDKLAVNQAKDLDNIVLTPGAHSWRTRNGDAKLNASALNSGAPVQGISFFRKSDGTNFLVAVAGTKFYHSQNFSGTFAEATGSITITSGADNKWDMFTFNDALIGFGGDSISPDAPFRWTGSGNAAALTGSPPSAYGAFSVNNRVFAFRTNANPSTIYWSVIGDAQDWTSSGSGSAVVGSLADNQKITGASVLSTNYALLFKQNSTYQMVLSASPFPVYTLFSTTGCVGKHAIVNVEGTVYFITPNKRMVSTRGETLDTYPPDADDLWNSVDTSTLEYTEGYHQKGYDYDWIVWIVTISSAQKAIIWDLLNKCWLRCTTGYNVNLGVSIDTGQFYTGSTNGFIYAPAQVGAYSDASDGSVAIAAYWRSGWINPGVIDEITQVEKMTVSMAAKASGSLTVSYGFDYIQDSKNFSLSQIATSTETRTQKSSRLTGRGNVFQYKILHSSSAINAEVTGVLLNGKVAGQKRISAG